MTRIEFCSSLDQVLGVFDCVSAIATLEHIANEELLSVYTKLYEKLVKERCFFISVSTLHVSLNPKHYRQHGIEELSTQIKGLFTLETPVHSSLLIAVRNPQKDGSKSLYDS